MWGAGRWTGLLCGGVREGKTGSLGVPGAWAAVAGSARQRRAVVMTRAATIARAMMTNAAVHAALPEMWLLMEKSRTAAEAHQVGRANVLHPVTS